MTGQGLEISRVAPEGIAEETGLAPGDLIVAINGEPVRDLIDFYFLGTEEVLTVEVIKSNGEEWILDIEKDFDRHLGLEFSAGGFGNIRRCTNRCKFCFVDQMPRGMRKTLYIKDDDYRLSFWCGNFISLSNLAKEELERIVEQRLSPLYVSVHTTNALLRKRMLGNSRAGLIMEQLRYLAGAGIEMHTQVVLCPGLNDGEELERTVTELAGFWPAVSSLAVVPVGLTRFRHGLFPLRQVNREEARGLVRWVHNRQKQYLNQLENPFIFASDEFYLLSDIPVPPAEKYAGFPQVENGVGPVRLFKDAWNEVEKGLPAETTPLKAIIVTGCLGKKVLGPVANRLNQIAGLDVKVKTVKNNYFGPQVTVAGLITGGDIIKQIKISETSDLVVLPAVMLKDKNIFLDDLTLKDLVTRLGISVAVAEGPRQLAEILLGNPEKAEAFIKK